MPRLMIEHIFAGCLSWRSMQVGKRQMWGCKAVPVVIKRMYGQSSSAVSPCFLTERSCRNDEISSPKNTTRMGAVSKRRIGGLWLCDGLEE